MNNSIYLALGSNLGNKEENFKNAITKLQENNVKFIKSSPLYKTPALLLEGSPDYLNIPYLNSIIEVETNDIDNKDWIKITNKAAILDSFEK